MGVAFLKRSRTTTPIKRDVAVSAAEICIRIANDEVCFYAAGPAAVNIM